MLLDQVKLGPKKPMSNKPQSNIALLKSSMAERLGGDPPILSLQEVIILKSPPAN